jgi:UDP:flavonoid glycosyltransferase YjiC (YdhE family)
LGQVLRARGHRVTVVAPGEFETVAREHGLDFRPVVSAEENHEVLSNPNFWHPVKAARIAARWGMCFVERQYGLIAGLATDRDAVLVANPGIVAAKIVSEKLGRPLANLILQPWIIPSSIAPPVMFGYAFPKRTPRWVVKLFWGLIEVMGDALIARHINQIRNAVGLRSERRILKNWLSRELVIAMFPQWYGPPQVDWPSQIRLAGFPMFDAAIREGLPPDILKFIRAGSPPVVFTFGTGMMHAHQHYSAGIEACRLLAAGSEPTRAIFLTKYAEQLPASLPPFVRHCEFAAFQELFPHCAAVVHHGGIGTTAKALAAGVPQLILPFAFDQTDNATRVKGLGAGEWIKRSRVTAETMARGLERLNAPEVRERCRSLPARFANNDTFERSASLIEALATRHAEQLTGKPVA